MRVQSSTFAAALLGAAAIVTHANPLPRATSIITTQVSDATSQSWDYIVLGAGLTGLTVANRLSEDRNVTVLVVEAGGDTRQDPRVQSVAAYGQAFGSDELNWGFPTSANGKKMNAGKGLGGSTSINGAAWTRGAKEQYDDIEKLGNEGWNWESLLGYMKKSETFAQPNQAQRVLGAGYDESAHGTSGPLAIGYTPAGTSSRKRMFTDDYGDKWFQSADAAIGLRRIDDITAGDIHGTGATTPNSITPGSTSQERVSSATAYVSPIEYTRSNIKILTGYMALRARFAEDNPLRVNGVYVQQSSDAQSYELSANRAVIAAMGAIRTPAFLELSGIGDEEVLRPLGIATKVSLPGVGRNLQDQTMNSIGARPRTSFQGQGPSASIGFPSIYQLFSNATDMRNEVEANYDAWAEQVVAAGGAVSADAVKAQWKLITSQIWDQNVSVSELFLDHGFPQSSLGTDIWQLLVYSRGKTHITSRNAFDQPSVDPQYYQLPIDMDITVASLRAGRKIYMTSPLSEAVDGEVVPGTDLIPSGARYGLYRRWRDWALAGFSPVAHQIGTALMAPREIGGVVDSRGRVYGIADGSLRVVDASTLGMQASAHLSATLYGMAEKSADLIKLGE